MVVRVQSLWNDQDRRKEACRGESHRRAAAHIVSPSRHWGRGPTRAVSFHVLRGGRRVDDAHDGPYAREPQIEDVVRICRALNNAGARYVLIGGFAVIAHGGARTTKDIDLLVDAGPEKESPTKSWLT